MSLYGKEKRNPSSRYSRMEEPWLDEETGAGSRESADETLSNGYGVSDSYVRQASYGHPEGYYHDQRDPYYGPDDDGQGGYGPDGYGQDGYGPDAYSRGGYGRDGYGPDAYSRGGYGPDGYGPDAYGRDGYGPEGPEDWDAYEMRQARTDRSRKKAHKEEDRRKAGRKKSKAGFVVKLILLVIAAFVLFVVWRFSRMKHVSLNDILTNAGLESASGYREFVIYGVDSREGNLTKDAHSDTIILCSMNESTKEIRMVSVYRDTLLDNTNGEYHKATECYFYGGPSRSVNMLNKNLDLDLHDYITVDFNAVVKAVDLIGGVDVEVTEEEIPYINGYQSENAEVTGAEITPVESAGYQHLNGIQALAYCRIRYTEGWDYRRTERQRTVLSQIFSEAKSQGAVKMAQIVDTMLPYIATSFSNTEILDLTRAISGYTLRDSTGFPFEQQGANVFAGDCVVPVNLAQNVSELHAYLYQKSGYTPTQTVQDISTEIANSTGIY